MTNDNVRRHKFGGARGKATRAVAPGNRLFDTGFGFSHQKEYYPILGRDLKRLPLQAVCLPQHY
jgi:hypothetical protein